MPRCHSNVLDFTANFLRINIYLTQKIDENMLWNIAVNDAGSAYDPLTLLRSRTLFGRPDWKGIYSRLRMAIENGQYLPGTQSQLRTTVGVSLSLYSIKYHLLTHPIDVLLWPDPHRQGPQGCLRREH